MIMFNSWCISTYGTAPMYWIGAGTRSRDRVNSDHVMVKQFACLLSSFTTAIPMNSPKSPATTNATSPLRESTRNTADAITPSSSWSTASSSTSPLRISKHESSLTSDSVPNHHFHRLPPQLARRQSSSYNHVRNNALVSNSPFKTRSGAKPSRIPTPSRAAAKEDENKPEFGFKRRQSRGLQGLFKEQVVTKSPFLGDKRSIAVTEVLPTTSVVVPTKLPPKRRSLTELTQARTVTPPMPATPRNPRIADLSGLSSSPSPKSSLVSPKRLHGPRSLSTSPGSESSRRQRRKTVTFDERCDVLEFDQEEISEEVVMDTEEEDDDYGVPEPPSPAVSASTDGSYVSDVSDPALARAVPQNMSLNECDVDHDSEVEHSSRTPRISRDEVRRRLMEQRAEGFEGLSDLISTQPTPEASFDLSFRDTRQPELVPESVVTDHAHALSHLSDSFNPGQDVPLDFNEPGVDLGEVHSALDRLMLGVECGFGIEPTEGPSMEIETATDGDISASINASAMDIDCSTERVLIGGEPEVHQSHVGERHDQVKPTESMELVSTDEDTDEPVTPPLEDYHHCQPVTPSKDTSVPYDISQEGFSPGTPTPTNGDSSTLLTDSDEILPTNALETAELEMSISKVDHADSEFRTSTPPHEHTKYQQREASSFLHSIGSSASLTLPPLSFDPPSENDIVPSSWESVLSPPLSRPPQFIRDGTFLVRSSSTTSSATDHSIPPPVPPKEGSAIRQRDDFVKARRREMRSERDGCTRPAIHHEGRPSRRRSLSTGDAEDLGSSKPSAQRRVDRLRDDRTNLLDLPIEQDNEDDALGDLIDRELKIRKKPTVKDKNRLYRLREREDTIYASADDKVSHTSHAGDVDSGKAWRTVRRPSDMNEYSRQIKEYQAQQKPGKTHGKVFVKVLGIRGVNVPLPRQPTVFTCTLNNGIHFVTTPECRLGRDARIEQEFELIEHSKLEFTLTLTVRRDPHIAAQTKANATPPPPPSVPVAAAPPPPSSRGVRGFFGVGSSPKKTHKVAIVAAARATPEPAEDNLARYLKPDGTLARAFISFKEIAKRCDTRLFETSFPLIGQRTGGLSPESVANPWTMGEIVLQIFRLPPLPGIPANLLPQSLEECHRGLRHINWHKVTYHEGVLTQNGGDCRTWRRRMLRVIGSNLVAFNDVTKKATATIDLKKAIAVEDDDRTFAAMTSPASAATSRSRDEFDDVYRVERSFRLIFPNNEEISFFADNDDAKARWLEVFRALVGHIPPNPLWAELIWLRQDEVAKNSVPTVPTSR
ncbi:hypothetical protein K439DRAFT_1405122 [Ramaria rubella]|nr:hypothetical protein K439DRAFT_1405122 [Ramaria rubella]